jgi:hypothetical protein
MTDNIIYIHKYKSFFAIISTVATYYSGLYKTV